MLDAWYVDHWSPALDLKIIWHTVAALRRDEVPVRVDELQHPARGAGREPCLNPPVRSGSEFHWDPAALLSTEQSGGPMPWLPPGHVLCSRRVAGR